MACSLWLKQNAVVYGRTISPLNTVVSKAFKSLAAFQSANSRPVFNVRVGSSRNLCWQAPSDGFVKVNWDVAVHKYNRKMGIGVIVCDNMGEVLATLLDPKAYIIAPNIAEATSVLQAVNFTRELGFYKVVLEGDAIQVVQAHLTEEGRGVIDCMHAWRVNHVR